MYSLKFYLRNAKRGKTVLDKDVSVWLALNIHGERVFFRTSLKVNAKEWNFRSQERKGNGATVRKFNSMLREFKDTIDSLYLDNVNNPEKLKREVAAIFDPSKRKSTDFFVIHQEFIESMSKSRSELTIKTYRTSMKNLKQFSVDTGYVLTFESINLKFYDLYFDYWYEKGQLNDTIDKKFAILKTFLSWAFKRKYHSNLEYQHFERMGDVHHDIVTLTEQELFHIYQYEFKSKRLARVRDLFCFGCFTGQRWSDISQFKKEDLNGNVWTFVMEKGGRKKKHSVPLTGFFKPAYDILLKYDFNLPKITNQNFNLFLKEAAKEAGINSIVKKKRYSGQTEKERSGEKWEFMSSHMARRTSATILLNYLAPATVKELLGHSDIKTTMKYKNDQDTRTEEGLIKVEEMRAYMRVS